MSLHDDLVDVTTRVLDLRSEAEPWREWPPSIARPAFSRMPRPHHQSMKSPHSQTRNPKHTKLRKPRVTIKGTEGARARQIRTAAAIQAAPIAP